VAATKQKAENASAILDRIEAPLAAVHKEIEARVPALRDLEKRVGALEAKKPKGGAS
jgi:hypothetical protein